jgi:hypothetical protein
MKKISYITVLFWILFALALWAILSIGLNIIGFIKCQCISGDMAKKINECFLALSYSYMAGCIVYFLTVVLPRIRDKKIVMPALKDKVRNIGIIIQNLLTEFSEDTITNPINIDNVEDCKSVLKSRDWNDIIAMPQYMVYNNYIGSFRFHSEQMIAEINEIIRDYKSFLTSDQLISLENLRNPKTLMIVEVLSGRKITEEGCAGLADEFGKELIAYNELKKDF